MYSYLVFLLFYSSSICVVTCFNFDTSFPIVYTHPSSSPESYFGFSVILYESDGSTQPWVQIGAPKGRNPLLQNQTTGVILRCGIKQQCRNIPVTETNNGIVKNAFFGNSMDISDDGLKYAVCGHRWIYENTQQKDYYMQGACQWSPTTYDDATLLTPFKDLASDQVQTIGSSKAYNLAQGQTGFSAQFTKYDKDTELLLGAPGVYNWHGVPMIYRSGESGGPIASRLQARDIRPKTSLLPLYKENIPAGKDITQTNVFDLLGYAVTSGYFFDDKRSTIYYVASAPKHNMLGKVLIFTFGDESKRALNIKDSKLGEQFGEYFGGSLTSLDVNNDKFDDLIVGAPFHKSSKYDEGRIYLFLGSRQNSLQKSSVIDGKVQGGRFGQAVITLGDKDFDGFDDVAVAAPYEGEGSGVVYIYRGKSTGLEPEPSQKLIGKNFVPTIQAFGISLSKPADIDSNGNDDIAIGAFISGHTVLLRSKPAVILKQTITSVERLDVKEKRFRFVSCVSYHGQAVFSPTYVKRTIVVDDSYRRVTLDPSEGTNILKLEVKGQEYCNNISATLKEDVSNLHIPVTIKITLELIENKTLGETIYVNETVIGTDNFCKMCHMLNPYQSLVKAQLDVPFSLGCGDDNKCEADLRLTTKFLNLKNPDSYIIGSQQYLTMETTIQNVGENAYSTEINVFLPNSIRLRSIPSHCIDKNASHVECNVGNPLAAGKIKVIVLEFDMEEVNSGLYDNPLNFRLEVKTSSDNMNSGIQEKPLMLTRVADVIISGKSKDQSYSYGNITYGKSDFVQVYKLQKFGDSPISEIEWEINVPISVSTGGKDIVFVRMYPPQGILNGQPINCHSTIKYVEYRKDNQDGGEMAEEKKRKKRNLYESGEELDESKYPSNRTLYLNCSNDDVNCEKIICTAGPFRKQQNFADLQLTMKLDISDLADYLNQRDIVIVSTTGKVLTRIDNSGNERGHETSVQSVFIGPTTVESIPIWIIVVSVISGILLLILITLALLKFGFFKREKKLLLEEERNAMENEHTRPMTGDKEENEEDET